MVVLRSKNLGNGRDRILLGLYLVLVFRQRNDESPYVIYLGLLLPPFLHLSVLNPSCVPIALLHPFSLLLCSPADSPWIDT
jgi:hypothetical protein